MSIQLVLAYESCTSPLVGEGCEGLASIRELSRSWARGARPMARSAPALCYRTPMSPDDALASVAHLQVRTPHPTSARLGGASPSLRILLPQGEKRIHCGEAIR